MPFIQNIPRKACEDGHHFDAGPNSILIQISDPDMKHPIPKYQFGNVFQFKFWDEEDAACEDICTQEQANELVRILQHALDTRTNVIVHCVAGICRSGAVAEVGVMMGFDDPEVHRSPNLLVKYRMMKRLGWTYE